MIKHRSPVIRYFLVRQKRIAVVSPGVLITKRD